MSDYNGWTNYETWNVNLWLSEYFDGIASECDSCTYGELADLLESSFNRLYADEIPTMGPLADLLGAAISSVNWYEIAEHYEIPETQ